MPNYRHRSFHTISLNIQPSQVFLWYGFCWEWTSWIWPNSKPPPGWKMCKENFFFSFHHIFLKRIKLRTHSTNNTDKRKGQLWGKIITLQSLPTFSLPPEHISLSLEIYFAIYESQGWFLSLTDSPIVFGHMFPIRCVVLRSVSTKRFPIGSVNTSGFKLFVKALRQRYRIVFGYCTYLI